MFPCERCGTCCRSIPKIFFLESMLLPNGICKFLDEQTNLCKIYSMRPIFCNVDAYYEKYLKQTITREQFYSQNKESCRKIRSQLQTRENIERPNKVILSIEEIPSTLRLKLARSESENCQ